MDSNIFKGYYDILDEALDIFPLETQTTLEFVRRKEEHSVVIYIRNNSEEVRESIDSFVGKYGFNVPRELYETGPGLRTGLIAIDLGTLATNNLRIYITTTNNRPTDPALFEEKWLWGIGYYLDKIGNIVGKKHYNSVMKSKTMEIDYFDENDDLISSAADSENITDDWTKWGGPKSLYDAVRKEGLHYQIAHKNKKDKGYFIVSLHKKIINNKKTNT